MTALATIPAAIQRQALASKIIDALTYARNAGLGIDINVGCDIAEIICPRCDTRLSFRGHHWHPDRAARLVHLFVMTHHAGTETPDD
jgi:hypothetical protein